MTILNAVPEELATGKVKKIFNEIKRVIKIVAVIASPSGLEYEKVFITDLKSFQNKMEILRLTDTTHIFWIAQ